MKGNTLDLTPLFCLWSIIFVITAAATQDAGWLWWAAAPWLFVIVLTAVVLCLTVPAALLAIAAKKFARKH